MIKTYQEFLNEADEYLTRFRDDKAIEKVLSIAGFSEDYPLERVQKFLSKVGYDTTKETGKEGDFLKWKSSSDKTLNQMFNNLTLKIKNSGFIGIKIWKTLPKGEPQFINESAKSDYQVYHNTYKSAINTAIEYTEKLGYTFDENETFNKIGLGERKPIEGKTNKFTITLYKDNKEQKKALHIQIYGMKDKYELNLYIN